MEYTLKALSGFENALYVEGCSIIISNGVLYKIAQTDELVVQLKFKNISDKTVKAIKVAIKTFDTAGNVVDENIFHQYLDLAVSTNQEYSDRKGLFLTNNTVRSFNVKVVEVVFADGVVWCGNEAPERLSKQSLEEKLSGELVLQYRRELGTSAKYVPFEYKDVWCCTCGNYNHNSNSTCLRCKREKDKQFYFFDEDVLIEKKRLLDEEKAKLEAKRQEEKQAMIKKTKKLAKIVLPMVCAIVVLIVLINTVIIPSSKYRSAVKLMNNEEYDEAIAIFTELEDYKDSEEQISQCNYNKAVALMDSGDIVAAYEAFIALGGYSDSADKASSIYDEHVTKKLNLDITSDYVYLGSYPQSKVKKSATISKLNSLAPDWSDWASYGYYSGTGSYGTMTQGDWMRYTDVTYGGEKYRGVKFTQYRPYWTCYTSSNTFQDDNGYSTNTTYWFKFESLK